MFIIPKVTSKYVYWLLNFNRKYLLNENRPVFDKTVFAEVILALSVSESCLADGYLDLEDSFRRKNRAFSSSQYSQVGVSMEVLLLSIVCLLDRFFTTMGSF